MRVCAHKSGDANTCLHYSENGYGGRFQKESPIIEGGCNNTNFVNIPCCGPVPSIHK